MILMRMYTNAGSKARVSMRMKLRYDDGEDVLVDDDDVDSDDDHGYGDGDGNTTQLWRRKCCC